MNNHYICVEYVCIRHCTYVVGSVLLVWVNFCMETRFFRNQAFLMNFEFLSTTFNQGTIIWIENIIIVNKIDKFNVSGFRNTQAHSQRSSQCGERPNQSRAQILDFWTSISRNSLWNTLFIQNIQIEFLSTEFDSTHPEKNMYLICVGILTSISLSTF